MNLVKKSEIPKPTFDEPSLKEPRGFLEEIKTLLSQGAMDNETALEETGRHAATIVARKKREMEHPELFAPQYEKGQGQSTLGQILLDEKESKKPGQVIDKTGRTRTNDIPDDNPRPSTSALHIEVDCNAPDFAEVMQEIAPISTLPLVAMKIWERVYRAALKAKDSVKVAARKAWAAIKRTYRKNSKTGKWVKKSKAGYDMKEFAEFCPEGAKKLKEVGISFIDIDLFETEEGGKYELPTAPKDAPEGLKDILDKVYNSCRKDHPGEIKANKTMCSRIAWYAVENAGYKQNKDGKWVKGKK